MHIDSLLTYNCVERTPGRDTFRLNVREMLAVVHRDQPTCFAATDTTALTQTPNADAGRAALASDKGPFSLLYLEPVLSDCQSIRAYLYKHEKSVEIHREGSRARHRVYHFTLQVHRTARKERERETETVDLFCFRSRSERFETISMSHDDRDRGAVISAGRI